MAHRLRTLFGLTLVLASLALGVLACNSVSPTSTLNPTAAADVVALVNEAKTALQGGNANLAVEKLQQALRLDPNAEEALYLLGNAYTQQGQLPQAEEQFLKALKINGKDADARSNLGVVYYRQGKLPEAEQAFRAALSQKASDADIHYNLGGVLAAENKLDDAVSEFKKAEELNPSLAEPYLGLGSVYKLQGKKAEAIAALQEYLKRSQDATWRSQAEQMLKELGAQP